MQVFGRDAQGCFVKVHLSQLLGFCCAPGIDGNCPKLPLPLETSYRLWNGGGKGRGAETFQNLPLDAPSLLNSFSLLHAMYQMQ